jgi:hypothetical protein
MTSFQRSKVIAERIEYGETNLPVPPGGPPYPPALTRPGYLVGSCGHQLDSVAAVPLDEEPHLARYLGNRMTCWHDDCKIPAKPPREPQETDCTWVVRSADGNERRCLTEARWNTEAGALCTKHRNALSRKGYLASVSTEIGDGHQGPELQQPTDLNHLLDLDDEQAREFGVEVTGIRLSDTEPDDSKYRRLTLDVKLRSTTGTPLTGWTVDWNRFDGEDYLIDSASFGESVVVGSNRARGYVRHIWHGDERRLPLPSRVQVAPVPPDELLQQSTLAAPVEPAAPVETVTSNDGLVVISAAAERRENWIEGRGQVHYRGPREEVPSSEDALDALALGKEPLPPFPDGVVVEIYYLDSSDRLVWSEAVVIPAGRPNPRSLWFSAQLTEAAKEVARVVLQPVIDAES